MRDSLSELSTAYNLFEINFIFAEISQYSDKWRQLMGEVLNSKNSSIRQKIVIARFAKQ